MKIRLATEADIPSLSELIQISARELSQNYYQPTQVEAALKGAFGVDSQLIRDQTYYLAEQDGQLAAAGGWSFRATSFGGDAYADRPAEIIDPAAEPAKIRAFFTHPNFARQGLATQLLAACEAAGQQAGFTRFQLTATLPGVPFYLAHGYHELDRTVYSIDDQAKIEFVTMLKDETGTASVH